jgi:hypothetical protein
LIDKEHCHAVAFVFTVYILVSPNGITHLHTICECFCKGLARLIGGAVVLSSRSRWQPVGRACTIVLASIEPFIAIGSTYRDSIQVTEVRYIPRSQIRVTRIEAVVCFQIVWAVLWYRSTDRPAILGVGVICLIHIDYIAGRTARQFRVPAADSLG